MAAMDALKNRLDALGCPDLEKIMPAIAEACNNPQAQSLFKWMARNLTEDKLTKAQGEFNLTPYENLIIYNTVLDIGRICWEELLRRTKLSHCGSHEKSCNCSLYLALTFKLARPLPMKILACKSLKDHVHFDSQMTIMVV